MLGADPRRPGATSVGLPEGCRIGAIDISVVDAAIGCYLHLTVVRTLQEGQFAVTARRLGERLRRGLLDLQARHDRIGDVRGRGLLQGIELVMDRETKEPADDYGTQVTAACFQLGLHLNIAQLPGVNSILRLAPPLTIAEEDIDAALAILDQALTIALDRGGRECGGRKSTL